MSRIRHLAARRRLGSRQGGWEDSDSYTIRASMVPDSTGGTKADWLSTYEDPLTSPADRDGRGRLLASGRCAGATGNARPSGSRGAATRPCARRQPCSHREDRGVRPRSLTRPTAPRPLGAPKPCCCRLQRPPIGVVGGVSSGISSTASWLDSLFEGAGRELLARAALARGADSAARAHAERAVADARNDRDRGVREVLLARALDRQALGDSAAAMYLRAARRLPSVADWLELRAAGATADASRRQRNYAPRRPMRWRARAIAPTEAQARERWRDFDGRRTRVRRAGRQGAGSSSAVACESG